MSIVNTVAMIVGTTDGTTSGVQKVFKLASDGSLPPASPSLFSPTIFQTITTTGTSAQSAAFNAATLSVLIFATQDSFILFGSNPTASSSTQWLAAGFYLRFPVTAGQKIAGIQAVQGGTIYISEGN